MYIVKFIMIFLIDYLVLLYIMPGCAASSMKSQMSAPPVTARQLSCAWGRKGWWACSAVE